MDKKNIEWKTASLGSEVINFEYKELDNGAINFEVTYNLPGVQTTFISNYTMFGDAVLKIENTLNESNYKGDIPRIGMVNGLYATTAGLGGLTIIQVMKTISDKKRRTKFL